MLTAGATAAVKKPLGAAVRIPAGTGIYKQMLRTNAFALRNHGSSWLSDAGVALSPCSLAAGL